MIPWVHKNQQRKARFDWNLYHYNTNVNNYELRLQTEEFHMTCMNLACNSILDFQNLKNSKKKIPILTFLDIKNGKVKFENSKSNRDQVL